MTPPAPVRLTGDPLTPEQVERVARAGATARLAPAARDAVQRSRNALGRAMQDGQPHYGCNTGFGAFARTRIPDEQLSELQHNLIRSHAPPAPDRSSPRTPSAPCFSSSPPHSPAAAPASDPSSSKPS